jgi:alcohol dehydrogenase class IV
MRRPLLVTDEGLASLPIVHDVVAVNERAGLPTGVFSGVRSNPNGSNVGAGVTAYRAGRHDGVIAMGGGSALDAGKTIALMVGQSSPNRRTSTLRVSLPSSPCRPRPARVPRSRAEP